MPAPCIHLGDTATRGTPLTPTASVMRLHPSLMTLHDLLPLPHTTTRMHVAFDPTAIIGIWHICTALPMWHNSRRLPCFRSSPPSSLRSCLEAPIGNTGYPLALESPLGHISRLSLIQVSVAIDLHQQRHSAHSMYQRATPSLGAKRGGKVRRSELNYMDENALKKAVQEYCRFIRHV